MKNYLKRLAGIPEKQVVLFGVFVIINILLRQLGWIGGAVVLFEVIFYMCKIWCGYKKIKNGSLIYIVGDQVDLSQDQIMYARCTACGMAGIILGILGLYFQLNDPSAEYVYVVVMVILLFFGSAYYSIKRNSLLLKCISLFSSTVQGLLCIMVASTITCNFIVNRLCSITGAPVEPSGVSFLRVQIPQIIIALTYCFERQIKWTVGMLLITIILYFLVIFLTPIYQFQNLKLALQIVNICMTIIGVIAFFSGDIFCDYLRWHRYSIIYEFVDEQEVYKYALSYGVSQYKNLFYLMVLPYTCGILFANIFVNLKNDRIMAKKKEVFLEIVRNKDFQCQERIQRYYALGGNSTDLKIVKEIYSAK